MTNRFHISRKTMIIAIVFLFSLLVATLFYIETQIMRNKPLVEMDSRVFDCPNIVQDEESAAECFNIYFSQVLEEEILRRGEGSTDEHIIKLFEKVDETQIFSGEGGAWNIKRNGYGSPYFIRKNTIMFSHG